jgi:hypothetical protein
LLIQANDTLRRDRRKANPRKPISIIAHVAALLHHGSTPSGVITMHHRKKTSIVSRKACKAVIAACCTDQFEKRRSGVTAWLAGNKPTSRPDKPRPLDGVSLRQNYC